MSLINDALKRAKATQPKATASAAGPVLRPVIASRRAAGNDFLLPALIVVILLLGGLLLWHWFRGETTVRARTISAPEVFQPAPAPVPLTVPVTQPPIAVAPEKTASVTSVAPAPTNTIAAIEPTVPVPAPVAVPPPVTYKLQSIFYRPNNPTAVINGKIVSPGTRLGDVRVIAIDKDSATLVTATGQTNILELP